jgi:hypothetical protein
MSRSVPEAQTGVRNERKGRPRVRSSRLEMWERREGDGDDSPPVEVSGKPARRQSVTGSGCKVGDRGVSCLMRKPGPNGQHVRGRSEQMRPSWRANWVLVELWVDGSVQRLLMFLTKLGVEMRNVERR